MILISHRGNISGRFETNENNPDYIDLAISKGYDVEVDIWYKDDTLWLGHDMSDYSVDLLWFVDRIDKLWIHCKNVEAVNFLKNLEYKFNYFWHENDTITLTSLNHIWAYPGKQPIENSIAVMPEIYNDDLSKCLGICSDFVEKWST